MLYKPWVANGRSLDFADPMTNSGWWLYDDGSLRCYRFFANDDSEREQFAPGDPYPPGSPVASAMMCHYGMVRLERIRRGVRIEWDVCTVDPTALSILKAWLKIRIKVPEIRLRFYYGGWATETYTDSEAALRRVDQLSDYRGSTPSGLIACTDQGVTDLNEAKPLLRAAYQRWTESRTDALELFDSPFREIAPHTLSLSEDNTPGNLFYRKVGSQAYIVSYLGREWARDVVGTLSTRGHVDVEFENVVAEPYFEALRTGEPHYGHVRALFDGCGQDPAWVSYQRLVLPYHTPRGQRAVAIAVIPDQNVAIPFLNGKTGNAIS